MSRESDLPAIPKRDFYQRLRNRLNKWVDKKGQHYDYAEYVMLAPDLIHLLCRLIVDSRISKGARAILAVAIAYFISPVDLIPEMIVGPSGYIDDVAVAVFALNKIINKENQDVIRSHWAGEEDILEVIQRVLKIADDAVGSGAWEKIKEMFSGDQKEE